MTQAVKSFVLVEERRGRRPGTCLRPVKMVRGVECVQCRCCDRWKPLADFPANKAVARGVTSNCRACRKVYDRACGYGRRRLPVGQRPTAEQLREIVAKELAEKHKKKPAKKRKQ